MHDKYYRFLQRRRVKSNTELPTTEELYGQILRILKEKGRLKIAEIRRLLADYYWLSEDEVYYTTEYGSTPVFNSRLQTALKKLLDVFAICRIEQGVYEITKIGRQLLENYPEVSDNLLWILEAYLCRLFPDRFNRNAEGDSIYSLPEWLDVSEMPDYNDNNYIDINEVDLRDYLRVKEEYTYHLVEEMWNLSVDDIERLYDSDIRFRRIIETGLVHYKNGILQIALPKRNSEDQTFEWITHDNVPELRLVVEKNFKTNVCEFAGVLGKPDIGKEEFREYLLEIYKRFPEWADLTDIEVLSEIDDIVEEIERANDPYEALRKLIKNSDVAIGKLADKLHIDVRHLRRHFNGETPIKLDRLVEICILMRLPEDISNALIKKFNVPDNDGDLYEPRYNRKHKVWRWLLRYGQTMEWKEIVKKCKENQIPPVIII